MNKTKIDWCDMTWNAIPNYPGYYASHDGRILSCKRRNPIEMRQMRSSDGYKYVFMYKDGVQAKVRVHRAVLMAWNRPPLAREECRHLNDNPDDNRVENLAWGTRIENVKDKRKNGRLPIGERSGTHILTEHDVRIIRALHGAVSLRRLAKAFGVSHTAIRRAALGIKWAHMKEVAI